MKITRRTYTRSTYHWLLLGLVLVYLAVFIWVLWTFWVPIWTVWWCAIGTVGSTIMWLYYSFREK